jgi:hypothetical protein
MVPLRSPCIALIAGLAASAAAGCDRAESAVQRGAGSPRDSMGVRAREVRRIRVRADRRLVEGSAAVMSAAQPGVVFTINDSGNEPLLFALDTTGAGRGVWRVRGATNLDWEAAALAPCASPGASATRRDVAASCLYIGDVGDNLEALPVRTIYRVREPTVDPAGASGDRPLDAERLVFRYADGPHDVEAMYVAPDGDVVLITKRPRRDVAGRARLALVFRLPVSAWTSRDSLAVAVLDDSLPIVPGSARLRYITDASLSPDARYLAVRTYRQVFVFAADPATGRALRRAPAVCNIAKVQDANGEGITWIGATGLLLLTAEGRNAPMHIVRCPVPGR